MDEYSIDQSIPQENAAEQVDVSPEQIRRKYLNHEASVRSIGVLYYIGAILIIMMGIMIIVSPDDLSIMASIIIGSIVICLGIFQLLVGMQIRKLKKWTKIPVAILSGIGVIGAFPIGTIIHGYILYLVFCKKGAVVFSDDYRQVIEATPDIKYKTSVVIWILLGLLIALLVAALLGLLLVK